MKFKKLQTPIQDLYLIEPKVFGDDRGFFYESYNKEEFKQLGIEHNFIQDNHSRSSKGVLRGLHFQTENIQTKLIRVVKGEVFDVAVDLRKGSPNYLGYFGKYLSEENKLIGHHFLYKPVLFLPC